MPDNFSIALALGAILAELDCPAHLQTTIANEFWARPEAWQANDYDELITKAQIRIAALTAQAHRPLGSWQAKLAEHEDYVRHARDAYFASPKPTAFAIAHNAMNVPESKPEPKPKPVDPEIAERVAKMWQPGGEGSYNRFVKGKILEKFKAKHIDHIGPFDEVESLVWSRVLDKIHQFQPRGATDDERRKTTMRWLQLVVRSVCANWFKSHSVPGTRKRRELQAGGLSDLVAHEKYCDEFVTKKTGTADEQDLQARCGAAIIPNPQEPESNPGATKLWCPSHRMQPVIATDGATFRLQCGCERQGALAPDFRDEAPKSPDEGRFHTDAA
jgi:hypothetical protein